MPPRRIISERTHALRSAALPSHLQQAVPRCAQTCLESFIDSEYACSARDLSCLCSRYSSQGFTLGELAYGCSYLHCNGLSEQRAASLYSICSEQSSTVEPTHSTVTLPTTATTFASATTFTVHGSTTHTGSISATSSNSAVSTTSTGSAQPSTSSTIVSSTHSATPIYTAPAPSDDSSEGSNGLTIAQAVGISVASMGSLSILIAIIFICLCCRRRRKSNKSKSDCHRKSCDSVESSPRFSPRRHGGAGFVPLGAYAKAKNGLPNEKSQMQHWYGQQERPQHAPTSANHTERALQPQTATSVGTRASNDSMRTVSQLLPEKPGTTPPLPAAARKQPRPASTFTTATIFEEHATQSSMLSPTLPPPLPEKPKPAAPKRPERPAFTPMYTTSPDQIRQPALSLDIPRRVSNEKISSPINFLPPPPIPQSNTVAVDSRSSSGSRVKSTQSSQPRSSSNSYLPNYYTSAESRSPAYNYPSTMPTPIENQAQTHRAIPVPSQITITKPTYPPRAVRASTGSDTSFESTDPDEPTPPSEEEKQLSPVVESPISAVKYPKVPRSSNQTVPRSPKPTMSPSYRYSDIWPLDQEPRRKSPDYHAQTTDPVTPPSQLQRQGTVTSLSLSGSTLAVKRRGKGAAHTLKQGLHINDSAHSRSNSAAEKQAELEKQASLVKAKQNSVRQESPLKGYGRRKTPPNARLPPAATYARKPSYTGSGWGDSPTDAGVEVKDKPVQQFAAPRPGEPLARSGGQEVALRSPLWEPKLTPSRRGEDLYLSVGVQTPVTPGFRFATAPASDGGRM